MQRVQGRLVYRGLARRGAALFHSLIANHPFTDGNKRTAVIALDQFLIANNHILLMSQEELIELALLVADRRSSHDDLLVELTSRIANRSKPFSWVPKGKDYDATILQYREMAHAIRKLITAQRKLDQAGNVLQEIAERVWRERKQLG